MKRIGYLIVAAEGMAEIKSETWWQEISGREQENLLRWMKVKELADRMGRPYWLIAILDHAPDYVQRLLATQTTIRYFSDHRS